jgi:DNA-binding transcriptional LysR family regulator
MWLLPRIASFHEANGDIQLNLACSCEDVSFTSGYYDIDIWHGYAHWTDVATKTLRNEFIAPLASEDYLKRFPVCKPEGLLARCLILSDTPLVQWQQWFDKFGVAVSRKATYDFSFDRSYMSLEAAALGHGIALEAQCSRRSISSEVLLYRYSIVRSKVKSGLTIWFALLKTPIYRVSPNS